MISHGIWWTAKLKFHQTIITFINSCVAHNFGTRNKTIVKNKRAGLKSKCNMRRLLLSWGIKNVKRSKKFITFLNYMTLVIPLHFIWWKETPNDAVTPQRQSQFICELTITMNVTEWQVSWNSCYEIYVYEISLSVKYLWNIYWCKTEQWTKRHR